MENEGARRLRTFFKILGIVLVVGAVCYGAVKLYRKFFPKEQPVLDDTADDIDAIETPVVAPKAKAQASAFEVPAGAVIANADQMEA